MGSIFLYIAVVHAQLPISRKDDASMNHMLHIQCSSAGFSGMHLQLRSDAGHTSTDTTNCWRVDEADIKGIGDWT